MPCTVSRFPSIYFRSDVRKNCNCWEAWFLGTGKYHKGTQGETKVLEKKIKINSPFSRFSVPPLGSRLWLKKKRNLDLIKKVCNFLNKNTMYQRKQIVPCHKLRKRIELIENISGSVKAAGGGRDAFQWGRNRAREEGGNWRCCKITVTNKNTMTMTKTNKMEKTFKEHPMKQGSWDIWVVSEVYWQWLWYHICKPYLYVITFTI